MIGLRPEKKAEYIRLHANAWPEILAILKKCHIQNYSIYLGEVDGKLYLFSYFEYTGEDIAKDVAVMKADAKTREWWTHTDPCQIRLPDTKQGDWWKGIPEVFHMDHRLYRPRSTPPEEDSSILPALANAGTSDFRRS